MTSKNLSSVIARIELWPMPEYKIGWAVYLGEMVSRPRVSKCPSILLIGVILDPRDSLLILPPPPSGRSQCIPPLTFPYTQPLTRYLWPFIPLTYSHPQWALGLLNTLLASL